MFGSKATKKEVFDKIAEQLKVVPPFCILAGNTSDGEGSLGMNGTSVSNRTRSSPINISH